MERTAVLLFCLIPQCARLWMRQLYAFVLQMLIDVKNWNWSNTLHGANINNFHSIAKFTFSPHKFKFFWNGLKLNDIQWFCSPILWMMSLRNSACWNNSLSFVLVSSHPFKAAAQRTAFQLFAVQTTNRPNCLYWFSEKISYIFQGFSHAFKKTTYKTIFKTIKLNPPTVRVVSAT